MKATRKVLLVTVLSMVVAMACAGTAFADNNLQSKKTVTKGENIASVPNATFEFVVENGSAGKEVVYAETAQGADDGHTETTLAGITGGLQAPSSVTVAAGAETSFNFTADPTKFSSAGIYRYVVYEKTAANTDGYNEEEGFKYDETMHYVDVYIKNNDAGTALECDGFVVTRVDAGYNVAADNTVEIGNEAGKKEFGAGGKLTFNNIYAEQDDPTPGKLHTLKVTKAVEGNQANLNETFPFRFEITANDSTESFTYKVFGSNGVAKSSGTANSGTPVTNIALGNGEYFEVYGLSVNDQYSVSETDLKGYTQTISGTASSTMGSADKTVAYTNAKNGSVPTGIFLSYWPIFLVAASLLGIVAVVATRRKKSDFTKEF